MLHVVVTCDTQAEYDQVLAQAQSGAAINITEDEAALTVECDIPT